jgi:hypothetical protein
MLLLYVDVEGNLFLMLIFQSSFYIIVESKCLYRMVREAVTAQRTPVVVRSRGRGSGGTRAVLIAVGFVVADGASHTSARASAGGGATASSHPLSPGHNSHVLDYYEWTQRAKEIAIVVVMVVLDVVMVIYIRASDVMSGASVVGAFSTVPAME